MPACVYFSSSETFAYWAFDPFLAWVCSFVLFHSFALPVLWTSLSLLCLHVDLLRPSGQKKAFGSPKLMGCTASSNTHEQGGLLGVLFLGVIGQGNRGCV